MKLSVLIPAHNEVDSIAATINAVADELEREGIDHEILVIDDASGDGTGEVVRAIAERNPRVRCERSRKAPGFGHAVRTGLERLQERVPQIGDVRGLGCMLAIELVTDRQTKEPNPDLAQQPP